jgi:protein-S-isoprenylcysteine O-methyltransferase Ste14
MPSEARALLDEAIAVAEARSVELCVARAASVQPSATGRTARVAGNALLAAFFALLCASHVDHARATGAWLRMAPLLLQEGLLVALFLTRRAAVETSPRRRDWLLGVAGVVLPLLLRPAPVPGRLAATGDALQTAGIVLALLALASLGRRVGVVAANRGVATAGPYRVVRHPAYAAYLVAYVGYVVSHPTPANAALVAAWIAVAWTRALAEERLLGRDTDYARYLARTPWRFVPHVC